MANNPVANMFKVKELRDRMLFTLLILAIFRLGSVLTIPGIDASLLLQYFNSLASGAESAFASYMDFFAGGAFERFSVLPSLSSFPAFAFKLLKKLFRALSASAVLPS